MAVLLQLTDARQAAVAGKARLSIRATRSDGSLQTVEAEPTWPPAWQVPAEPAWRRAEITITHPDYVPHVLGLIWDGTRVASGDPCTRFSDQGGDRVVSVPLGRLRFAPGQNRPWGGKPTGDEQGVFIMNPEGQPQKYGGYIDAVLSPSVPVRMLKDYVPMGKIVDEESGERESLAPTCLLNVHEDDGWRRFVWGDEKAGTTETKGVFVFLEYGSASARPTQPRFLVAVWAPNPADAVRGNAVDAAVFFSPSTATDFYPVSRYPFRDKYPYAAFGKEMVDPDTGLKYDAMVQPYVILGTKYLFSPTFLAPTVTASGKPMLLIMPLFPNSSEKGGGRHMWQPFNSHAGLYRLLLEIVQFLEREGYGGSSFNRGRFYGAVAPSAGTPVPPPAFAYSPENRPHLDLRQIIVAGYSSASLALVGFFGRAQITGSAGDYPPELFGADAAEFGKRWAEFWDLDFSLDPAKTGVPRANYEKAIKEWLNRETRRARLYHGGWTLGGTEPDQFFPLLRKEIKQPRRMREAAVPSRWTEDWRDASGRLTVLFFSGAALRATASVDKVIPRFPLGDPAGTKGDPASMIHSFAAQLGFGHALSLRPAAP
jgi:hypothetical protein